MSDEQRVRQHAERCGLELWKRQGYWYLTGHAMTNTPPPGALTLDGVERWLTETFDR